MSTPHGELAALTGSMTPAQLRQLVNIARAMQMDVDADINPASDIVTPEFNGEMTARLQAHHGTHSGALDRISWEDAYIAGAQASGRLTSAPLSATNRYFDKIVDG